MKTNDMLEILSNVFNLEISNVIAISRNKINLRLESGETLNISISTK